MPVTAITLEGEGQARELIEREQKKNEYRTFLSNQIAQKQQLKQVQKQKDAEEEAKAMHEFANYYRIGARNQGGGSPIRDKEGNIIA